ncbi:hypothetical protein [Romboutsia sp. Marseille-P6047]|uniref:hypothetical protein n=1 Tax=Romboutsia sp. Marseille-P6047 TaxID=2161817 RepID=UPI000F066893|nr:hypothetical protein [Romboutsia sp. Marseille-P6047]
MFKKLFSLINKKKQTENLKEVSNNIEVVNAENEVSIAEINEEKLETDKLLKVKINEDSKKDAEEIISKEEMDNVKKFLQENEEYIKNIKINRGRGIRAIDLYSEEVLEFNTYKECSRKLKVPLSYIKENLKYGHTDYMGSAINYLKESLGESMEDESEYLNSNKTPIELFNYLNDKIFSNKISEEKREEILSSDKIEPLKMHYKFECIDKEYDDYFTKYGTIIKRGGNKKIELVNQKGEVIEVFKSLVSCCDYLNKDKNEITYKLKHGYNKVGRYEIRYSLRNI